MRASTFDRSMDVAVAFRRPSFSGLCRLSHLPEIELVSQKVVCQYVVPLKVVGSSSGVYDPSLLSRFLAPSFASFVDASQSKNAKPRLCASRSCAAEGRGLTGQPLSPMFLCPRAVTRKS